MNARAKIVDQRQGLIRRLRLLGPVTLAEYMGMAMVGDGGGYYAKGAPIGATGDFITAPEISQMFGELIGLWCVDAWDRMGQPNPLLLVELGPGRGTMMADALRAARLRPDFLEALRLHLVEISEPLRRAQQAILGAHAPAWHPDLASLPLGPAIVLANEFLDVLPIHQFQMTEAGWRERGVGLVGESPAWILIPPGPQLALLRPGHRQARIGEIVEINAGALALIGELSKRLEAQGGAALFIDYGPGASGIGDTFQALRDHRFADPLQDFGAADLTAHVDFEALRAVAREAGARTQGPVAQGAFLARLGIGERACALAQDAGAAARAEIEAARERLIARTQMGNLFKVMALRQSGTAELAGFA